MDGPLMTSWWLKRWCWGTGPPREPPASKKYPPVMLREFWFLRFSVDLDVTPPAGAVTIKFDLTAYARRSTFFLIFLPFFWLVDYRTVMGSLLATLGVIYIF